MKKTLIRNEFFSILRCTAKNKYFKSTKIVRQTLKVIDVKSSTTASLLPKLQNGTIIVPSGDSLRLHCAAHVGNSIHWTFIPRNSESNKEIPLVVSKPNELNIDSTSVKEHDGTYKCWSGSEFQVKHKRESV